MMKKINGIGLLELLLSLVIIALLLLSALRFYNSVQRTHKVNEAAKSLQAVMAAVDQWMLTYKRRENPISGISILTLQQQGLLPKTTINPWGGHIVLTPVSARNVRILFSGVPSAACMSLIEKMQHRDVGVSCRDGDFSAIYPKNIVEVGS